MADNTLGMGRRATAIRTRHPNKRTHHHGQRMAGVSRGGQRAHLLAHEALLQRKDLLFQCARAPLRLSGRSRRRVELRRRRAAALALRGPHAPRGGPELQAAQARREVEAAERLRRIVVRGVHRQQHHHLAAARERLLHSRAAV